MPEAPAHIERQVDGVELDVGNGVQQAATPAGVDSGGDFSDVWATRRGRSGRPGRPGGSLDSGIAVKWRRGVESQGGSSFDGCVRDAQDVERGVVGVGGVTWDLAAEVEAIAPVVEVDPFRGGRSA